MKKILSICAAALLVASAAPVITQAEYTNSGTYVYSTGYVQSNGNAYGYIGNDNGTAGISYTDAKIVDSNGYVQATDVGYTWSKVNGSVKPGAPGSYVQNRAKDSKNNNWTPFTYRY